MMVEAVLASPIAHATRSLTVLRYWVIVSRRSTPCGGGIFASQANDTSALTGPGLPDAPPVPGPAVPVPPLPVGPLTPPEPGEPGVPGEPDVPGTPPPLPEPGPGGPLEGAPPALLSAPGALTAPTQAP